MDRFRRKIKKWVKKNLGPQQPVDLRSPLTERMTMEISYENDLHRVLYVRVRHNNKSSVDGVWRAFRKEFPEYAHLEADWKASRMNGASPMDQRLPWVSYGAIEFLRSFVKPHFKVFEWGMGGSTLFWSDLAREVVAVEHDAQWHESARVAIEQRRGGRESGALEPVLLLREPVRSDQIGEYFSGLEQYVDCSFESYVREIEHYPEEYFDLVVVDGRARMASLRAAVARVAPGGAILLDNSDYTRYQAELDAFWATAQSDFDRKDFITPTPFSKSIGSKTTVFLRKDGRS